MKKGTVWGTISVAVCYAAWGLLTVFWNLLDEVNPVYILSQRIIWSMVFMAIYMLVLGKWHEIKAAFADKKILSTCMLSGILVTINWGVYIYAINSGHVLDASLGYFIEPVLVGTLGVLAFKERLSKMEKITFACAIAGVIYMVIRTRTIPVMALIIGISFAFYGAVKKQLTLTPHASLFMETLCMTPFALLFVLYAETHGIGGLGVLHGAQRLLLPACGIVTSVPLLLFNIGVKKIPYYISGILMYINPTLQFFMGIFYFKEPMNQDKLVAFIIIWIGILFTVYEKGKMIRGQKSA